MCVVRVKLYAKLLNFMLPAKLFTRNRLNLSPKGKICALRVTT